LFGTSIADTSTKKRIAFLYYKHSKYFNKRMYHIVVRLEVFAAVNMKNTVFRDMKTHFIPHRKHIMSPLKSPAG
jgi:hypothetical protein